VVAAQDARAVVEDLLEKINSLVGVALPVVGVCEIVACGENVTVVRL
jgi:hypothetical protein